MPRPKKTTPFAPLIARHMTMGEIIERYPQAQEVMDSFGLHCGSCSINTYDTLEDGVLSHGMTEAELATIEAELNAVAQAQGGPQPNLTAAAEGISMTPLAARKVREFAHEEGMEQAFLLLEYVDLPDGSKDYFLDFTTETAPLYAQVRLGEILLLTPKQGLSQLEGLLIDFSLNEEGFVFQQTSAHQAERT